MQNLISGVSRFLWFLGAVWVAGFLIGGTVAAVAKPADDLDIVTVSTRPDTVSGGNVLVRINARRGVAINDLIVLLNGQNITGAFRPETGGHSLLGLVDGLNLGENSLVAKAVDANNVTYRSAHLTLTNYPITGPILSGPHEEPFYCMTQLFTLPASTNTLGPALDADCSIATRPAPGGLHPLARRIAVENRSIIRGSDKIIVDISIHYVQSSHHIHAVFEFL